MKKRRLGMAAIILAAICMVSGCARAIPKDWYEGILENYKMGFSTGWKSNPSNINISEEMQNGTYSYGYLLKDLDGDGADELLIGIDDGAEETKFTDVYIYHSDVGPFQALNDGDGYYMYICDGSTLRVDSWYGSETKTEYMKYNSKNNAFLMVDGGSKPGHYTLTPFN